MDRVRDTVLKVQKAPSPPSQPRKEKAKAPPREASSTCESVCRLAKRSPPVTLEKEGEGEEPVKLKEEGYNWGG